jgi:AP-1-like factor
MNFESSTPLWDFSQSTDYNTLGHLGEEQFLELLQKQFSQEFNSGTPVTLTHEPVVDPSKLTSLPTPNPPPPLSTDSSPSPSSLNEHSATSRRQSRSFDADEPAHKRKAIDDDDDDELEEGPSHKTC